MKALRFTPRTPARPASVEMAASCVPRSCVPFCPVGILLEYRENAALSVYVSFESICLHLQSHLKSLLTFPPLSHNWHKIISQFFFSMLGQHYCFGNNLGKYLLPGTLVAILFVTYITFCCHKIS